VTAQLVNDGIVVNHKKVMRLMKEHGLTVRPRRRFVATTDSDHDGPIFPNLAKDVVRPFSMPGRDASSAMRLAGASMGVSLSLPSER
jgi:hypothetical protein